MGKPDDIDELLELKRRFLAGVRSGDIEEAIDASIETYAHHGIVRGNVQMMDRAIVASGVAGSLADKKRMTALLTNQITKALASEENPDKPGSEEPDYEARLADA